MSALTIDNVENVVNAVELLKSMYYGEDEFSFRSDRDATTYNELQQLNEAGTVSNNKSTTLLSDSISFEIKLTLSVCDQELPLSLFCQLSIRQSSEFDLAIASANSAWLSREDHGALSELLQNYEPSTTPEEDRASCILEKIQYIQGEAEPIADKAIQEQEANARKKMAKDEGPCTFLREWIWFPMIYTREKRGHIIDWAPKYKITGFLCPGKPGAMCLEGKEKDVARFINDIKTVSWSDIPASHRKMTSKWQEKTECESLAAMQALRRFPDMKEYKFDIHGQFANHNDLNKLQDWMKENGCGEAFDHLFDYDLQN